ncbi:hypothetical protein OG871_38625 [Kitasatospora sp. NBC_00374]|uniref:hypothetical protein n=1 Tax=Kitasatospora sp. NBC_00374 TaxID=2975964 RepID=UPI0030DEB7FD
MFKDGEDVNRWTTARRHLATTADEALPGENGVAAHSAVPVPFAAAAGSEAVRMG